MALPYLGSEEFDEQAQRLYEAGDDERALNMFREGLTRYPEAVELHVGLGYVRLSREEYVWALHAFDQALAIEPEHEEAWAGRGESLLKFGRYTQAMAAFARLDQLGLGDDADLGLAVGRALYREGFFCEARDRFKRLLKAHPGFGEGYAALAYAQHALGDESGARGMLKCALDLDPALHEARIYFGHLLYERGDLQNALEQLQAVPPAEHWEPVSLWRVIDLVRALGNGADADAGLAPWHQRLAEVEREPDGIDHLLAEVEAAFECHGAAAGDAETVSPERRLLSAILPRSRNAYEDAEPLPVPVHRVRTTDGRTFVGSWEDIVRGMRDALSDASEPVALFMFRAAQRLRRLTGSDVSPDDAEALVRASERAGLLSIEL